MARDKPSLRGAALTAATVVLLAASVAVLSPSRGALFDTTGNSGNTFTADVLESATGLSATCGASITLDWTATADTYASGHRVLRATSAGGPYTQIAEVTPRTTTSYVDSPAAGTYYYVVRAFYQTWESVNSNEAAAGTSCETSATFTSVADTQVRQDKATTNYGSDITMLVRSWQATKNARAFVQFDVSSIPAGSTINSATLTLCATSVPSSTRTYNLHQVTAGWVETTLTWNNQPSVAATPTDSTTTPGAPGCMTWTVTADVQAWVDGTANNGWRVSDSVEAGFKNASNLRTREDTAVPAEQPKLDVVYTAP